MSLYLKQIEQMVELQKIDDEIYKIRKELTAAPKEIEELKKSFQAVEYEKERIASNLEHLQQQEKKLNLEIEDESSKIKKSKSKFMQVETDKEYQAMMREMESLEKNNKDREVKKGVMSEEVTRQKQDLERIEQQYNELRIDLQVKETSLAERTEKIHEQLKEFDLSRREASKNIPLPILSRYEFIRERLPYPVIVSVTAAICSGCNITIPPQSFIELQKGTQILSCPNCQRLIYWNEHFKSDDQESDFDAE